MRRRVHSPLLTSDADTRARSPCMHSRLVQKRAEIIKRRRAQAATERMWLPQLRCKLARTAYTKRKGAAYGQAAAEHTVVSTLEEGAASKSLILRRGEA